MGCGLLTKECFTTSLESTESLHETKLALIATNLYKPLLIVNLIYTRQDTEHIMLQFWVLLLIITSEYDIKYHC